MHHQEVPGQVEALAAALEEVSIPTLLCTMVHITGDPAWVRGYLRPAGLFLNEYQGFMDALLERPYMVGSHWFKYFDQPATGWIVEGNVAAGQTVIAEDVDQRIDSAGPGGWHSFGLVTLGSGQNTIVLQLTDNAAGYVIADAVQFIPLA